MATFISLRFLSDNEEVVVNMDHVVTMTRGRKKHGTIIYLIDGTQIEVADNFDHIYGHLTAATRRERQHQP